AEAFGGDTQLRHFVTNIVISVDGDRASTRAAWFEAMNNGPDGSPAMGSFGHYDDELARIDGRWRFKFRRINNEFLEGRQAGPVNPVTVMDQIP
ncbi:MAG: nuclear transport factor 2 family protein, partial [Alphaproteobacteria bacterium]|nr:nuclear transport factor 2 family protein [Alphaproteobacteria bacterium]